MLSVAPPPRHPYRDVGLTGLKGRRFPSIKVRLPPNLIRKSCLGTQMLHLKKVRRAAAVVWLAPKEHRISAQPTTSCSSSSSRGLHRTLFSATRNLTRCVSQFVLKEYFKTFTVQSECGCRSGYPGANRYSSSHQDRRFCSQALAASSSSQSTCSLPEAQTALLEYLYDTRMLQFPVAEHISKNSPIFLCNLMKKARDNEEAGGSVARFLRYHPINEFEPFFESLGLSPPEWIELLSKDKLFLRDDAHLLQNYYVLCSYGIAPERIGKIYKEATEIFSYMPGVLHSKFEAYEGVGLNRTSIIRFASVCPSILVGDVSKSLLKLIAELRVLGISHEWLGNHLSLAKSYNWDRMFFLLHFLNDLGLGKEGLTVLTKNASLLLEDSGNATLSLVGLLLKLGSKNWTLLDLFARFPGIGVHTFLKNLRRGLSFLVEIEMQNEDICRIVHSFSVEIGYCSLKTARTVLTQLHVTKRMLRRIIIKDPSQLMNWTLGNKSSPLPKSGKDYEWLMHKAMFLLGLGFGNDPKEMDKALSAFHGKGKELQERYDFLVKRGLHPNDVKAMIKKAPHILNQKLDVLESKVHFLVDVLDYPLDSLLSYPSYLGHTIETVKLRHSMYTWLIDKGALQPLALSTILACSEERFVNRFVRSHPNGLEVWEYLKTAIRFT